MSATIELRQAAFTIQVDVESRASEGSDLQEMAARVEQTLARLTPVIVEAQEAQRQRGYDELVVHFLGDSALKPLDVARARMKANALRAVHDGTEWLTAAQIAQFAGFGNANPSGTVNRWKQRRRIFALEQGGQDHYPRYLLDDTYRPLAAAEEVLAILADFSPHRLASWFESRNGLLGGDRPREVIGIEPGRVVEAASHTIDSERHAA